MGDQDVKIEETRTLSTTESGDAAETGKEGEQPTEQEDGGSEQPTEEAATEE